MLHTTDNRLLSFAKVSFRGLRILDGGIPAFSVNGGWADGRSYRRRTENHMSIRTAKSEGTDTGKLGEVFFRPCHQMTWNDKRGALEMEQVTDFFSM